MKTLKVELDSLSYNIIIKKNSLKSIASILQKTCSLPKKGVIISNRKVFNLYGAILEDLNKNGYDIKLILVPEGESAKSLVWAEKIYHKLLRMKLNRQSFLIALGGGIVGDLTGFVASTFLRGIPFIQIPTSLLAQVDSSVGGKVAVNLKEGKNLIGHFYQPKLVLIDPLVLKTLPLKEFKDGMAEVIKYGFIIDRKFFNYLLKNYNKIMAVDLGVMGEVIYHSVRNKAKVVSIDEKEKGLRAILNFGHTFGHAIEKTWNYKKYSHGEAVAIGMYMAALFSKVNNILDKKEWDLIDKIYELYKLPGSIKTIKGDEIVKNLYFDKKMTSKGLNYILLKKIGQAFQTCSVNKSNMNKFILDFVK